MEKKMTYAVALDNAIEVVVDEVTKARLKDLKASLEKKASPKKSVDNSCYYDNVKKVLADGAKTPTELVTMLGVTNTQKVTAICKPLIESGKVVKNTKGKKVTYSLA